MTTVLFALLLSIPQQTEGPFQATGIKICEVDATSAVVWTRLTRIPERVGSDRPLPRILYKMPGRDEPQQRPRNRRNATPVVEFPDGATIDTIEGAAPGIQGQVRVRYKPVMAAAWTSTEWKDVVPDADYTRQFGLPDLRPGTSYAVLVEARKNAESKGYGSVVSGGFRTAPAASVPARVVFTVSTGQAYIDQDAPRGGYLIYDQMLGIDPDFFVHTGDILYYDRLAKTQPLALWHWQRMYSLPTNVEFHRRVASYFIKDDHDTWVNDCWPTMETKYMGEFTFKEGLKIFPEQVGLLGRKTYRTIRWGKDLQVWMVEGRDFRSSNRMADGPEKTIWGKEQKEWFKRTVRESDATFRILISPTPVVGPDRKNKHDNHSNDDFATEGNEIRSFLATQKNVVVVCGDRHWQYVSEDLKTKLREYSCGPASDKHAGGWSNDMLRPEHKYLNVVGGYLAGIVERVDGKPFLVFRHYSVEGKVLNEDRLEAKD